MGNALKFPRYLLIALFAMTVALTGCGSDGSDGKAGTPGDPGRDGLAKVSAVESCTVCHGENAAYSVGAAHVLDAPRALQWDVASVTADTVAGTVTIDVAIDDKGYAMTNVVNVRAVWDNAGALTSTNNAGTAVSVDNGDGTYTITITVGATLLAGGWDQDADIAWRIRLNSGVSFPEASVFAYQNDGADVMAASTAVSDQSCINCHGNNIFVDAKGTYMSNAVDADGVQRVMSASRQYHFSSYGAESCVMCHGTPVGGHGDRLMIYAHGIHNSNAFNGNYGSTAEVKGGWNFSVRYPGVMTDCTACHTSDADLAAVLAAPVSYNTCISCHGGLIRGDDGSSDEQKAQAWRGLSDNLPSGHLAYTAATDCTACHSPSGSAGATVGDYHLGYNPELIAARDIKLAITGVVAAGFDNPVEITWQATNDAGDTLYDACNVATADGPKFLGEYAVRIAYFEPGGDDITNKGLGGNPGQPGGTTNITADNTVCDANGVATTTVDLHAGAIAERAMITFDGRARIDVTGPSGESHANQQARIAVPSYSFDIKDGASSPRRQIIDSAKCLACHQGSMYRHGGGRNDNVDSCIACHNSGATDQYVRAAVLFDGADVTAANAFDGKSAETFSMGYNMHAIHSAGATDAFYVVYRTRGVYGYGGEDTLPANWPVDADGNAVAYVSASNSDLTVASNGNGVPLYLKKVDYPRPLQDCTACHFEGTYGVADQSKTVAVSMTSGIDFADQDTDTLIGPATATCFSCHQSGDKKVQAQLRAHGYQNSWVPSVFPGGKEDVLEFRTVLTETE